MVLDANGVPILMLSDESRAVVDEAHAKAVAKWESGDDSINEHLLLGTGAYVDNQRPILRDSAGQPTGIGDEPDVTRFSIGSSSLDEALKDVVGAFEGSHGAAPPRWVCAEDERLALFLAEHYGCKVRSYPKQVAGGTRVAIGRDIESTIFQFANMFAGNSTTAPTATTFTTDGVNIPVNSVVGQYVVRLDATASNRKFGIIQSNTSAAASVLTIDRWYDPLSIPANRGVAAAATPAAGGWAIVGGNVPAAYMGLTANSGAAADGDTTLTGEITLAGGGLIRQNPTYAHTLAATTTTLTQTFTCNGTDSLPVTVAKIGIFQGVEAASRLFFETILNATMAFSLSGDQGQVTETVTL